MRRISLFRHSVPNGAFVTGQTGQRHAQNQQSESPTKRTKRLKSPTIHRQGKSLQAFGLCGEDPSESPPDPWHYTTL